MVQEIDPKYAVKHIADLMKKSKKTVVFTGAGISTESGLPDFRSNGGLWDGKDPMKISHADTLKSNPIMLAEFYTQRLRDAQTHYANKAHLILADWEYQGKIWGISTQNIDGYHTRAGSKNVCELHGNLNLYCPLCEKEYSSQTYLDGHYHCMNEWEGEFCSGIIRPNVTLFGEDLPTKPYHISLQHFSQADLCIILGSSCSVYPANSLPQHTISNGGQVIIINKTDTELDYLASYKISSLPISKALEAINKELKNS